MMISQQTICLHLGIIFDTKLNFPERLKNRFNKVNKTIELLRKPQNILPQAALLSIYKSFRRPHYSYSCCAPIYIYILIALICNTCPNL